MSRVHTTLRQAVRDWSSDGVQERISSYGLVIDRLLRLYPLESDQTSPSCKDESPLLVPGSVESALSLAPIISLAPCDRVPSWYSQRPKLESRQSVSLLTPGSGLSRITWELARLGFQSCGNEFSYYMLLASFFLLNEVDQSDKFTIFPWVMQTQNLLTESSRLRPVTVPDVDTQHLPKIGGFSMMAGDFLDVCSPKSSCCSDGSCDAEEEGDCCDSDECCRSASSTASASPPVQYSSVCSVFFLDCANNPIEYVRTISSIIQPGGFWINCGPLLYHYSDMPHELSVELTLQEILCLLPLFQLRLLELRVEHRCDYLNDPNSMLQRYYSTAFFVCQKISTDPSSSIESLPDEPNFASLQPERWESLQPEQIKELMLQIRPIQIAWMNRLLEQSNCSFRW